MIRQLGLATFLTILFAASFMWALFAMVPARAGEGCKGTWIVASWYGAESGSRTASGLYFDGTQMFAAHKSLPFGTRVKFTYKGKSVTVPIEDRGPYIKGRTFDLSRAAAERIGMIPAGVVKLCAERL